MSKRTSGPQIWRDLNDFYSPETPSVNLGHIYPWRKCRNTPGIPYYHFTPSRGEVSTEVAWRWHPAHFYTREDVIPENILDFKWTLKPAWSCWMILLNGAPPTGAPALLALPLGLLLSPLLLTPLRCLVLKLRILRIPFSVFLTSETLYVFPGWLYFNCHLCAQTCNTSPIPDPCLSHLPDPSTWRSHSTSNPVLASRNSLS